MSKLMSVWDHFKDAIEEADRVTKERRVRFKIGDKVYIGADRVLTFYMYRVGSGEFLFQWPGHADVAVTPETTMWKHRGTWTFGRGRDHECWESFLGPQHRIE
jgi:hypothetical protein